MFIFMEWDLEPVTDLLQGDCFLSTGLLQVVSRSCNKSANDKLQQAGKIYDLQQVLGVFVICAVFVIE